MPSERTQVVIDRIGNILMRTLALGLAALGGWAVCVSSPLEALPHLTYILLFLVYGLGGAKLLGRWAPGYVAKVSGSPSDPAIDGAAARASDAREERATSVAPVSVSSRRMASVWTGLFPPRDRSRG